MSSDASATVPRAATHRFDWLMAGLASVTVFGVYLGVWADSHGYDQGAVASPWYLPAFMGYLGTVVALLVVGSRHGAREASRRRRTRHLAPAGYEPALVGVALAAVALILDIPWQAIFETEVDIERNVAPPRILLAVAVLLMASGPMVAAWRRIDAAGVRGVEAHEREASRGQAARPRLVRRLPMVISMALTLAALGFLTFFATPATQHWAERFPGDTILERPPDVWQMSPDGTGQTRITMAEPDVTSYHEPTWLADGSGFMVTVGQSLGDAALGTEGIAFDVARMSADGSDLRLLTESPAFDSLGYISPDGARIAFSSERVTTSEIPTTVPSAAASGGPGSAPPGTALGPEPGRDPGLGVQAGSPSATGGRWDVYVVDADGSRERRLTEGGTINVATGWAPDGRILYHSDRDGDFEIYSMRADGSGLRQLTDDPADDTWPALAPDGRIAFTSDRHGHFDIWTAAPDGSDPRPLTDDAPDDYRPAWSPDGSTILFLSDRDGNTDIHAVPAGGGEPRNLTKSPAMDELIVAGAWSSDGASIVYSAAPIEPAAADPELRTLLALAAMVVWASVLAGLVLATLRRGALPRGALTVALLIAAVPAGLATDEPRVILAALVAGVVGDALVWWAHPGPLRPRVAWLLGAILPAVWTITYLAAVVMTTGSGLSAHVLTGAVVLAAVVGLLLAVVIVPDRPPDVGHVEASDTSA